METFDILIEHNYWPLIYNYIKKNLCKEKSLIMYFFWILNKFNIHLTNIIYNYFEQNQGQRKKIEKIN